MQPTVPLPMALMDFLPNLVFLLGAYWLFRCGYRSSLFLAGSALVFLNGLSKALWKLIVALGGPDIAWLSQIFVVLLSTGFLLMAVAAWRHLHATAVLRQAEVKTAPVRRVIPLAATGAWKIPFMLLALVSAVGLYGVLIADARRAGQRWSMVAYGVAILSVIVMGGLSGGEFNLVRQWTAQTVNLIGQSAFAVGAFLLQRTNQPAFS